ncbi:MAG: GIY-YIG nuclease family protein [Ignavibacteriae bacterium]|nr:GIY-YIG nuclease family protein [Ignavibacteriota bacterium]
MKQYYVYILASKKNGMLYIGVTNNLARRIYEHKNKIFKGFSSKYNCTKLVYFESSTEIISIINREKEIKKWRREKKNTLIASINPNWNDLSDHISF